MKWLLSLLLLIGPGLASAQDTWIRLIATADGLQTYFGLRGSYQVTTNKAGEEIVVMTEKVNDASNGRIQLQKIYVRTQDCRKHMGKSVVLDLDGNFKFEFDFIFDAGSVGSYRAQFLCEIYLDDVKARSGKGI